MIGLFLRSLIASFTMLLSIRPLLCVDAVGGDAVTQSVESRGGGVRLNQPLRAPFAAMVREMLTGAEQVGGDEDGSRASSKHSSGGTGFVTTEPDEIAWVVMAVAHSVYRTHQARSRASQSRDRTSPNEVKARRHQHSHWGRRLVCARLRSLLLGIKTIYG